MVIVRVAITMIYFSHALGPFGYFGPFDHAIKSQVAVDIATLASLKWSHARLVSFATVAGFLAIATMNTPSWIGIGYFASHGHYWTVTTMIDTNWAHERSPYKFSQVYGNLQLRSTVS